MFAEIYFSLNLVVLNFFPKIPPSERIGFYENRAFKNKQRTKVQHWVAKCKCPHKLYRKFQNLAAWKYIRRKTIQPQKTVLRLSTVHPKEPGGT